MWALDSALLSHEIRQYTVIKSDENSNLEQIAKSFPLTEGKSGFLQVLEDDIPSLDSISATLSKYKVIPGIRAIPILELNTDPHHNFYTTDDLNRIKELSEEIMKNGYIKPLILVLDRKGFWVLEGAHRMCALHLLQVNTLPALIVVDFEE